MKNKTQYVNFRINSNLYDELRDASRLTDLSCSVIARKGLKLILEQLRLHEHSMWISSSVHQGAAHERV
jgi:hypothetical protein